MDITKDAIRYINDLVDAHEHTVNGKVYTDKPLHLVAPPKAETTIVTALSSLVKIVKAEADKYTIPMFIHVINATHVEAFGSLDIDFRTREVPFSAKADLPDIAFNRFLDVESALIQLKSKFLPTADRDTLISLLGNIAEDNSRKTGDDGFSQTVTVRKGISVKENATIPTTVHLAPFRTFLEVEQPASDFTVRIHDGPSVALYEADGGAWQQEARSNITELLEADFKGTDGIIVIS